MPDVPTQIQQILQSTGPLALQAAMAAVEPRLVALGVTYQRNSAGEIRGRLFLADGSVVDVVDGHWGTPWVWIVRSGPTVPVPTPDPPPVDPPPPGGDLAAVLAALQEVSAKLDLVAAGVATLESRLPPPQPWPSTATFKFFGMTTTTVGQVGR